MLSFFLRGISVVFAILYTAISVGLSNVQPTQQATPAMQSAENIPLGSEKKTIHVLQNRKEIAFLLQQAFELYKESSNKKMEFSIQTVASESDYHSTLRAKLLSGEDLGLFQISGARERLELEKYIREIDLPWLKTAQLGSLDAVTYDNKLYGVPYSLEAIGLICNREIFSEAEIPLAEIASFEDLTKAFTTLQSKIGTTDSEVFASLEAISSFPAQDKAFLSSKFAEIALTDSFSATTEAAFAKNVLFPASKQAESLLKLLAKFSNVGSNWSKLAEVSEIQQLERFANGHVAVILNDTSAYRRINEINPKMHGNTFLLPIPLPDYEQPFIYVGTPIYWAINASTSDKSATEIEKFLTWLYTSDQGTELFASKFEGVSPFRKTAKKTGVGMHSQMLSYIDAGMAIQQVHREFPAGWGKNIFAENVQSYFTNRAKTWEEVITASAEGWQTPD